MAKEIVKKIKLQIEAGKATPAPPVGTALGPAGINIQEFCTKFNDETRDKMGTIIPCEISVYEDRSFDYVLKTPPAAFLIKQAAKIKKGSAKGANDTVGKLSKADLKSIAETKMPDLNAYDVDAAMKIIAGTAENMGVIIEGEEEKHVVEEPVVEETPIAEAATEETATEATEETKTEE